VQHQKTAIFNGSVDYNFVGIGNVMSKNRAWPRLNPERLDTDDHEESEKELRRVGAHGERPSHEEIASLAYRYWQERGYILGTDQEDWFRAEEQLMRSRKQSDTAVATEPTS
jgi:hypothetical protein